MTSVTCGFLTLSAHQKPTVGDTKTSVVGTDHMGWLLCDGRSISVTSYVFLFDVIGYSFGGSGSMFNLPNPAGRVPGFVGSGAGLTTRGMGSNVGEETHTLTVAEMPTHNHGITDPGHTHTYTNETANNETKGISVAGTASVVTSLNDRTGQVTTSSTTGITINNTGGSNAHNNMQPTLFMGNMFIYCGKPTYGTFPYTTFTPRVRGTLIA